jgi:hypothetical protein
MRERLLDSVPIKLRKNSKSKSSTRCERTVLEISLAKQAGYENPGSALTDLWKLEKN